MNFAEQGRVTPDPEKGSIPDPQIGKITPRLPRDLGYMPHVITTGVESWRGHLFGDSLGFDHRFFYDAVHNWISSLIEKASEASFDSSDPESLEISIPFDNVSLPVLFATLGECGFQIGVVNYGLYMSPANLALLERATTQDLYRANYPGYRLSGGFGVRNPMHNPPQELFPAMVVGWSGVSCIARPLKNGPRHEFWIDPSHPAVRFIGTAVNRFPNIVIAPSTSATGLEIYDADQFRDAGISGLP